MPPTNEPTILRPMKWDTQLNVRLEAATESDLKKEADRTGNTRSQIAREAILKELALRKRVRKLEREHEGALQNVSGV